MGVPSLDRQFSEFGKGKRLRAPRSCRRRNGFALESLERRELLAADIVIHEIYYDPPIPTERSEFIELFNNSDVAVDLSGWRLTNGIEFTMPPATQILPRSYLVIGEDPATLSSLFRIDALGPWQGGLRNDNDQIELRDSSSQLVDRVDYQRGFPWPTTGDAPGHSIELIHPDLDNNLGGSWRAAGAVDAPQDQTLIRAGSTWRYFVGTSEPSSPRPAYRGVQFDDTNWNSGIAPLGYGDAHVATTLNLQGQASSLYLRHTFQVQDPSTLPPLTLRVQFDDGVNLWMNGKFLAGSNLGGPELSNQSTATGALENFDFVEFPIADPKAWLVPGENVIAVQLLNSSLTSSSDMWFDADLISQGSQGNYSPGRANTVFATNAPPAARQVRHPEGTIRSGVDVPISIKVTDPQGVAQVALQYQVVKPGDYFGRYLKANSNGVPVPNPRYDAPAEWTTLAMVDDGTHGDTASRDDIFTTQIPAAVNQHRHLIRYRIQVRDGLGAAVQVPYADDPQFNFTYFVYDGVPTWTGAARPGRTPNVTYDLNQLGDVATYHLLTTEADHSDSQHIPNANTSGYAGSEYLWPGTMVYDGKVYDNISYRSRGGVWRYSMGKNMWKFDFNRGHSFEAKDDYGRPYQEPWDKLNFSAIIQQGDYLHRGEQGLFESVGFKLFNLAGVESPLTHYVHFRVIDDAVESGPDQFSGDFRGLYLAVEQPDGHFLDQHNLPNGNFYKIENYIGESNNQGPTQVTDDSDVDTFIATYRSSNPSADWWEKNLDLDKYFSYQSIVEAIHHYDIAYGKNYFYYHNPVTDKFEVHPWDLDLTWADNMYGSGQHDFTVNVSTKPEFVRRYQSRVRELVDLLYNSEQTGMLIDEMASHVYTAGVPSWVDADRAMWDYNPIMTSTLVNPSKSGAGRYYQQAATKDFAGMIKLMKNYVVSRASHLRSQANQDRNIPSTPTLEYAGTPNFPLNALKFQTSPFADPQGAQTFAAMEWRIAEITDPQRPQFDVEPAKYEIQATQESGVLSQFQPTWSPDPNLLQAGKLYRARVRMQDQDGQWSHWSAPVQFSATAAAATEVANSLRISELHYHPADASTAEIAAGFEDADEFEFLEFINIGSTTLDLTKTRITEVDVDGALQGINYDFSSGSVTSLKPGERLVLAENVDAFRFRYGNAIDIAGEWTGKLSNSGERLTVTDDGAIVMSFSYDDAWYAKTDGEGYSLEVVDPASVQPADLGKASSWKASAVIGGSPQSGGTGTPLAGDFNADRLINATDIDLLFAAIKAPFSPLFDLNGDRSVNQLDVDRLTQGILKVHRGDVDLNGAVDFSDFLFLASNFGRTNGSWRDGNFNGDSEINFEDFLTLSANFGKPRPA